jgi:hypothetical protein
MAWCPHTFLFVSPPTHTHIPCTPQVPLITLTEKIRQRLKSDTWGNYAFWLTFCIIGQPVCLLMYVHDYMFQQAGSYKQVASPAAVLVSQAAVGNLDYLREA